MLIAGYILLVSACGLDSCDALPVTPEVMQKETCEQLKWFTEFGHLNRGDMLTSEHYRCLNEKKKFQRRV